MNYSLLRVLLVGSMFFVIPGIVFGQMSFIYTDNDLSTGNSVSAFSVEANGSLRELLGSPFPTGSGFGGGLPSSNRIVVVGDFLYAANGLGGNISGFSINPATGNLTVIAGSPFPTEIGVQGISLAATPDRRFLFASHQSSHRIVTFSISNSGALTRISTFDLFVGSQTAGSRISPDGKFLAVTSIGGFQGGAIEMFAIQTDGSLIRSPGSPFPDGTLGFTGVATSVDFNCRGDLLFVGEGTASSTIVSVFNVASTGTLTPIIGTPFRPGVGLNSGVVVLSANGQFLFVSNQDSNSTTVFRVAPNGTLSLVAGSPFPTGVDVPDATPGGMAIDESGENLFTAVIPNFVSSSKINADGTLSPVQGSPATTNQPFGAFSLVRYPTVRCTLVPHFDLCLQDQNNGNLLHVNLATGEYQFTNCKRVLLNGTGSIVRKSNKVILRHEVDDRSIVATIKSQKKGNATIQLLSQGVSLTINDKNTSNNTCSCP